MVSTESADKRPEVTLDMVLAILGGVVVEKWLLDQQLADLGRRLEDSGDCRQPKCLMSQDCE